MNTADGGHGDAAIDALAVHAYEQAGDRHTRAGRRVLADPRDDLDPFTPDDRGWIGQGLQQLLAATVAYRVAGVPQRATQRAVEGIAATRDFETVLNAPGQSACLGEFVADFHVAGGLDSIESAYDEAADRYADLGDTIDSPQALATTPLFEAAAATIKQVARGQANGEIAIAWEDLHGPDPARASDFLGYRVRRKRQQFQSLIERAVTEGFLAVPRGTTEYDNETYQCPNCGSNDVNWAGNGVCCLRCSTPVEEI